jgi:hypothetical protein
MVAVRVMAHCGCRAIVGGSDGKVRLTLRLAKLPDYANDPDALHRCASIGDLDGARALLSSKTAPKPNAPDINGRSAVLYAQLFNHDAIVQLLVQHGWTPMPEGCVFKGAGGRMCYWSAGPWSAARCASTPARSPAPTPRARPLSFSARASPHNAKANKRSTLKLRRIARDATYRSDAVPGRNHKFYLRRPEGGSRSRLKLWPALNTRDFAEGYALPGDMVGAGRYDEDDDECTVAAEDEAEEDAFATAVLEQPVPGRPTLGRFVLDLRPVEQPSGEWMLVGVTADAHEHALWAPQPTDVDIAPRDDEEASLVADPADELASLSSLADDVASLATLADEVASLASAADDVASLASFADELEAGDGSAALVSDDALSWPALPARRKASRLHTIRERAVEPPAAHHGSGSDHLGPHLGADPLGSEAVGSEAVGSEAVGADPLGSAALGADEAFEMLDDSFEILEEMVEGGKEKGVDKGDVKETADDVRPADAARGVVRPVPAVAAWRGAAHTKAAICGVAGDGAGDAVRTTVRSAAAAASHAESPSPASADKSPASADRVVVVQPGGREEDEGEIADAAGLKDAAHRARGARGYSIKMIEKRDASVAKRQYQRECNRVK